MRDLTPRLTTCPTIDGNASLALIAAHLRPPPCLWDIARRYEDIPVYDGSRLAAGHLLAGPAVLEERTTTVVVPPGYACGVERWKNYILSRRTP